METTKTLTKENFEALLRWFASDRDEAGKKYEMIRRGLMRLFQAKGCADPEMLADETFNRVASKISSLTLQENVKLTTLFHGFAKNIYHEYVRKNQAKEVSLDSFKLFDTEKPTNETENFHRQLDCLDNCLSELPKSDGEIILQYYSKDKSEKFEIRRKLAEKLELTLGALHTRAHRIRLVLQICLEKCLAEN